MTRPNMSLRLATLLLDALAAPDVKDAVVGDFLERHAGGSERTVGARFDLLKEIFVSAAHLLSERLRRVDWRARFSAGKALPIAIACIFLWETYVARAFAWPATARFLAVDGAPISALYALISAALYLTGFAAILGACLLLIRLFNIQRVPLASLLIIGAIAASLPPLVGMLPALGGEPLFVRVCQLAGVWISIAAIFWLHSRSGGLAR